MLDVAPGYVIGSDTAATCWLCNRVAGELCHVHDPTFVRRRLEHDAERDELGGVVLEPEEDCHGDDRTADH